MLYRRSFLFLAAAMSAALFSSCSGIADGKYNIELYSQNDIHGRYFDSLYTGGKAHSASMANISEFIKRRRSLAGEANVILIDNGDHLQGDNAAYYFNYIEKSLTEVDTSRHLFSRIMNYLKFDAVVVGNHDIETGHPVYDRIVKELDMPYLAANAVKDDGTPYFRPYTILNKNGIRVAVIGMTNPNIKKWLAPALWEGMDFIPINKIADSVINSVIEKENPHIIVLAVHAGLGDGSPDDYENPARYLAANIKNVDIILSSHDHLKTCEKIWNGEDSVLLMEGGSRAEMLSAADIKLVVKRGKIVSKKLSGRLVKMAEIPGDTQYLSAFRGDFEKVKAFTNKKVGYLPRNIRTSDAFFGSSDYMDIIHYAQLNETGADISFAAPLTFNKEIKAGDIDYQDLFTIYPYENQLCTILLTGKQVKNYLEFSYNLWINTMKNKGDHIMNIVYNDKTGRYVFRNQSFNFDSGGGIEYSVDVTKPYGKRISVSGLLNGKRFAADSIYKVAISSYRANGGGDLLEKGAGIDPGKHETLITGQYPDVRDIIYKYFSLGNLKLPVYGNWKFIPESYSEEALKKDRDLLFRYNK